MELSTIKSTVAKIAEAITAVLGIETEIVDRNLKIIGGTGRYQEKIGSYEEDGNLDEGFIYAHILRTGEEYFYENIEHDEIYKGLENELAEITCPIFVDDEVVGLIGLVAFTEEQKKKIVSQKETLFNFLRKMASLVASKLSEEKKTRELEAIVNTMREGLIGLDSSGQITSLNKAAENLLNVKSNDLSEINIKTIFPEEEINEAINAGFSVSNKEIPYGDTSFIYSINPIGDEKENNDCIIIFEDIVTATKKILTLVSGEKEATFDNIIGESKSITDVKKRAFHVANSTSTILITGDSGTGKSVFAAAIHSSSERSDHPFISINCGAIPDMLLESELFGYEKGSFTGANATGKIGKFELANKGTLFLDEIGDMPLHLQVKLLHVLQNKTIEKVGGTKPKKIDVRIIAATNRNLEEMVQRKEFREDLYFRLNVIPLNVPSLSQRVEDIEDISKAFLKKFNQIMNKGLLGFEESALDLIQNYSWPGNIRELENVIEYAVNMESSEFIKVENLPKKLQDSNNRKKGYTAYNESNRIKDLANNTFASYNPTLQNLSADFSEFEAESLRTKLNNFEKQILTDCLSKTGHSLEGKRLAAKILGISESTLYRRLKALNV